MADYSPERRARIAARAAELIAEEFALRAVREAQVAAPKADDSLS